jgi:hypothetical protein
MHIKSTQLTYSDHNSDMCFEYAGPEHARVPHGIAVGYIHNFNHEVVPEDVLILFDDIKRGDYTHRYWNEYELNNQNIGK